MERIQVTVFRRFDNRDEGLSDDSPRAIELHKIRSKALHEALDGETAWRVEDWGKTDDSEAHEVVDLLIDIVKNPQVQAIASQGLYYIGNILVTAGVSAIASEGGKLLFSKLRKKQEEEKVTNINIQYSNNIQVQLDPPKYGGKVYVNVLVDQAALQK